MLTLQSGGQRYLDKFDTGCEHFYTKLYKCRLYWKKHFKNDNIQKNNRK